MFSFVYRNLFKTARPEVDCGVESGSVKDELDRWKSLRPLLPVDAAGGGEAAAGGEAAGRGLGVSTEGTSGPSLSIVSQLGDGSLSAEVFRAAAAEELLKNLLQVPAPSGSEAWFLRCSKVEKQFLGRCGAAVGVTEAALYSSDLGRLRSLDEYWSSTSWSDTGASKTTKKHSIENLSF